MLWECTPAMLNQQAQVILNHQGFDLEAFEELTKNLRQYMLMSMLPEHPGFTAGLNPLSLEMRRYLLNKLKTNPVQMAKEDATILMAFGSRLSEIVARYCPSPNDASSVSPEA